MLKWKLEGFLILLRMKINVLELAIPPPLKLAHFSARACCPATFSLLSSTLPTMIEILHLFCFHPLNTIIVNTTAIIRIKLYQKKMCCPIWPVRDIEYEAAPQVRNIPTQTGYRYQWNGNAWDLQRVQMPAVSMIFFLPKVGIGGLVSFVLHPLRKSSFPP